MNGFQNILKIIFEENGKPPSANRKPHFVQLKYTLFFEYTEEDIERRDPRWVSPTIVYLSSAEASDITGRVIQAGNGRVAVCEGWRRGAEIDQIEDAEAIGPMIRDMISSVRMNSGMDGSELD